MPDLGVVSLTGPNVFESYQDLKAIAEPSSPSSGYLRIFFDSTTSTWRVKHSNGDVVDLE